MSQNDVLKLLKKYPSKEFTPEEILMSLTISLGSLTKNLNSLRRSGMVVFKNKYIRPRHRFVYKHKPTQSLKEINEHY